MGGVKSGSRVMWKWGVKREKKEGWKKKKEVERKKQAKEDSMEEEKGNREASLDENTVSGEGGGAGGQLMNLSRVEEMGVIYGEMRSQNLKGR